jgi:hypothetical protein
MKDLLRQVRGQYFILPSLALLSLGATAPTFAPVPANHELGFVLTYFGPALQQGKDGCPDGLAGIVSENYLESLAPPERARLLLPENEKLLKASWQAWSLGPNHTNICADPDRFPNHGPQKTFKGSIAPGLDLDHGRPACGHEEFKGPKGEAGVDNQAYRAMGCSRNYWGVDGQGGDVLKGNSLYMVSGEHGMVVLVKGVDSLDHDDAVEVIFASTDDLPVTDSKQNFVTDATYTVTANPDHRNVLRGRIEKGVLLTEAKDVRLRRVFGHGFTRGMHTEWDLREGQLRLEFQPDGSATGMVGAYQTPMNIILSTVTGGVGAAVVAGMDCAAQYNTLMKLADGGRDAKSGRCTTVSVGLEVRAVSAFVFDRTQAGKVAAR